MPFDLYQFCKAIILASFGTLSLGVILSGLLLCLIKSPSDQADEYLKNADLYAQNENYTQSEEMIFRALFSTPYNEQIWLKLDDVRDRRLISQNIDKGSVLAVLSSHQK